VTLRQVRTGPQARYKTIRESLTEAVLVAGIDLVYRDELPIEETNPLRPLSPYGVSRVAQEKLAWQYHRSYGLKTVVTRGFNDEGPRRGEVFVTSSFVDTFYIRNLQFAIRCVPCLTLRENTERPVTVTQGTNTIVGCDPGRIVTETMAILDRKGKARRVPELWDGRAAEHVLAVVCKWVQ
jgi:hypothetical protein